MSKTIDIEMLRRSETNTDMKASGVAEWMGQNVKRHC
jgi:hypothetical protein